MLSCSRALSLSLSPSVSLSARMYGEGRAFSRPGAGAAQASDEKCKLLNRQFLATTSRGLSQGWKKAAASFLSSSQEDQPNSKKPEAYINELNLFSDASALDWSLPGTLNYYTAQWMMRADAAQRKHSESSGRLRHPDVSQSWWLR